MKFQKGNTFGFKKGNNFAFKKGHKSWKAVTKAQINIGDSWKTIF